METEIVRDSMDMYLELAEEELIQGQISELLHQREMDVIRHNGLKLCPICFTDHCNEGELCSLCASMRGIQPYY